MNEKFCPFISNEGKKRACQKQECILFDEDYSTCYMTKNLEKTEITINEGIKIAIGFSIWSFIIGIIIFLIFWFIIPMFNNVDSNSCYENPITGEKKCY